MDVAVHRSRRNVHHAGQIIPETSRTAATRTRPPSAPGAGAHGTKDLLGHGTITARHPAGSSAMAAASALDPADAGAIRTRPSHGDIYGQANASRRLGVVDAHHGAGLRRDNRFHGLAKTSAATSHAAQRRIIGGPRPLVSKDLVSGHDLAKRSGGLRIGGIQIRMPGHGHTPEGPLDLLLGRILRKAQDFIVCGLRHEAIVHLPRDRGNPPPNSKKRTKKQEVKSDKPAGPRTKGLGDPLSRDPVAALLFGFVQLAIRNGENLRRLRFLLRNDGGRPQAHGHVVADRGGGMFDV